MDIKSEIVDYLEGRADDVESLFDYYGLDPREDSDSDFESCVYDDEDLRSDVCDVIYHDPDEVVDNVFVLDDADVDDATLGNLLRDGNWAGIESIIRETLFYQEIDDAISEYLSNHEDELEEIRNEEDEDDDSEVEEDEDDYDEGLEDSRTLKRKRF